MSNKLPTGIEHGPYPAYDEAAMNHYIKGHLRAVIDSSISDEQLRFDIEGCNQGGYRADAVLDDLDKGLITRNEASIIMRFIDRTCVYWRNPGE